MAETRSIDGEQFNRPEPIGWRTLMVFLYGVLVHKDKRKEHTMRITVRDKQNPQSFRVLPSPPPPEIISLLLYLINTGGHHKPRLEGY